MARDTRLAHIVVLAATSVVSHAAPPTGFVDEQVLTDLDSPAGFRFAPDGRIFYSERINGRLRTATYDAQTDTWSIEPTPYYTFEVPNDGAGTPVRHRSSGLRDFTFDPDFEQNGHVYAVYMRHNPRHNRVVRITQDPADPTRAIDGQETLLLDLPFNSSGSSGSHNGAAIEFGADGMLYISTGDGWNGGDGVQSLDSYTGKVFRIAKDGTIPADNPFFDVATGPLRAVYCLGLRNPYSMTFNPTSGRLYVNDAIGSSKTSIVFVEPGANFGHQGYGGLGVDTDPWHNSLTTGGNADKLITGGVWYPDTGPFPAEYWGRLFVAHWGSNGSSTGVLNTVLSESQLVNERFASDVAKPVNVRVGPDGCLYYMYTTYETNTARIHRITHTGQIAAATPTFDPPASTYIGSVSVTLESATPGASIRYTLDGSDPTVGSLLYVDPIVISESTTVRARAFADGAVPSSAGEAFYTICQDASCNQAPVAIAGNDKTVVVGAQTFLSGSASFDTDTDEALLMDGWTQIGGPAVALLNDDETVAYFTPSIVGKYTFEYSVDDGLASDSDRIDVFAVSCVDSSFDGLVAEWLFDEGVGAFALDSAAGATHVTLDGPVWTAARTTEAGAAIEFDGVDDATDVTAFDLDTDTMTISAWIRIDDFDQMDGRIISKASGVSDQDHYWMLSTIAISGGHGLRFRLKTDPGTTSTLIADTTLPTDVWVHAAAVYDGATMRLYQDGIEVGVLAKSGRVATDPTVPVAIGNQPQRGRPFDGAIDEIRIFDVAVTADDLARLTSRYRAFDLNRDGRLDVEDLYRWYAAPLDLDGDGAVTPADAGCLEQWVRRLGLRG